MYWWECLMRGLSSIGDASEHRPGNEKSMRETERAVYRSSCGESVAMEVVGQILSSRLHGQLVED